MSDLRFRPMTLSEDIAYTKYVTGFDPEQPYPTDVPRQTGMGDLYGIFAEAVAHRERVYGMDRDLWPSQHHRPDMQVVDWLEGTPFADLLAAAIRAADPADRDLLQAMFSVGGAA